MKKQYMKPSMMEYELKGQAQLLAGSVPEYPDLFGAAPGITSGDGNHLA